MFFFATLLLSALATLVAAAPLPNHSVLGSRALRELTKNAKAAKTHKTGNKAAAASGGAPYFVYYADRGAVVGTPPPASSSLHGWNVFALSFWLSNGPADWALGWADLTADQRKAVKDDYNAAGIKLIVAAFGSTETPTSSGGDPTQLADKLADFVTSMDLDGADIDYEDFNAMNGGTAVPWLVTFTKELRSKLGDSAFISHAPVAPWFTDSTTAYPQGDYLEVEKQAGDAITAYNIQFYNQGVGAYEDCDSLINNSNVGAFPNTALLQIAKNVNPNKLVLGKPAAPGTQDANNGYVAPETLAQCVKTAKAAGWNGGLMLWEFPDAPADFVSTVWGSDVGSGSGSGSGSTTTSAQVTSTSSSSDAGQTSSSSSSGNDQPTSTTVVPTASSTSSDPGTTGVGGTCATSKAWDSQTAYTAGSTVTYNGKLFVGLSWSYNEVPTGVSGAWKESGSC